MKKNLYTIFKLVLIFSAVSVPRHSIGQCLCSGGIQPDSTVYTYTLLPTSNFSTPLTFPKFDPTVGSLNCVTIQSHINTVASLGIRNLDSLPHDYEFLFTQFVTISGPGGLNTNSSNTRDYGPTTLDPYNGGIDSVHYGPDTTFSNEYLSKNTSSVGSYLGTGTVTINFTNTGNTLLLQGSNNYRATVTTVAWGDFRLVYYWCQTALLATNLRNFSAVKKDKLIDLQWLVDNEELTNNYEIEISNDGRSYASVGHANRDNFIEGITTKYEYQYHLNSAASGHLFFRVKQTDASGKVRYSTVRIVTIDDNGQGSVSIYPNPVKGKIGMQFDRVLKGSYKIDITNMVGQTIYSQVVYLNNQDAIQFNLPSMPPTGVYYLRMKGMESSQVYSNKLFIQR